MGYLVSDMYENWKMECEERFQALKSNEEELNRIFIDIYGLQDELAPEEEDKDVTVRRIFDTKEDIPESMRGSSYALTKRDGIVSLISYAVGCMFGRYSLDVDGLAYAGGDFSDQWVVVSGQLCLRRVVEYYVGKELSGACGMAEIDGSSGNDLPADETASERGVVFTFGSDAQGGGFDSLQYRRGTSKKLYEGIHKLPVDCKGVESGSGNPAYDLCSPEILDAITGESGAELVQRGWQDADCVDWKTIHSSLTTNHFHPDRDGILPISDDEYFDDDIVGRFVKFIEVVYGKETLEENLKFIADALGGTGTSREVIRKYFLNDFYADHLKTYQKRPIYWLFDSGKKNGFKCLVYMHRCQPDTIARIRTDYVHEQQSRYRTAMEAVERQIANAHAGEHVRLNKRLSSLQEQAEETRVYEEKIHHLADQFISIDLDDGVKMNYAKFQDVLAKLK